MLQGPAQRRPLPARVSGRLLKAMLPSTAMGISEPATTSLPSALTPLGEMLPYYSRRMTSTLTSRLWLPPPKKIPLSGVTSE